MSAADNKPDWERIEADYRAGILSLREVAAKDGNVTEGAIRKRAKKLGWGRDLGARIQAKAEELVRKEAVRAEGTQPKPCAPAAERLIVEANAEAIAQVRLRHRADITRIRNLCMAMLGELEVGNEQKFTVEELADALHKMESAHSPKAAEKAREVLARAMSIPSRSSAFKALTDAFKTLVTLEREAWGLKADDDAPNTQDAPIIGFGYPNGGPGEPDPSAEGS